MTDANPWLAQDRISQEGRDIPASLLSSTIRLLMAHESVRDFAQQDLPSGLEEALALSARSAPSSSNLQGYSIIFVRDYKLKARLACLAGDQQCIRDAPLFVIFCADIYRLKRVSRRQGRSFDADTLDMFLLATIDASLAMQNALVAAESLGLSTVPIGAVRNDPLEVARELQLPRGVFAIAGLCVGYGRPGARRGVKPRLPAEVTVHHDRYRTDTLDDGLERYDQTMARRGTYKGRRILVQGEPEPAHYGWAEHTARRCALAAGSHQPASLRKDLRQSLLERGFNLR